MKIINHEKSSKIIVIPFDEYAPLQALMAGETYEGQPVKLIVLPKTGPISLSVLAE